MQILNFLAAGSLTCAGAVGVRGALRSGTGAMSAPVLMGAVGAGLIGAGVFATDTEDEAARSGLSRRGALHVGFSVPVFLPSLSG